MKKKNKVREKRKFVLFACPLELHQFCIYKYSVIILEDTILTDFGIVCVLEELRNCNALLAGDSL